MIIPTVYRRGYKAPLPVTDLAVPRAVARRALRATVRRREEAVAKARQYEALAVRCHAKWTALADRLHLETFGKERGFLDYQVSGIGREAYPDQYKPALRALARGGTTAAMLAHLWRHVARWGRGWEKSDTRR